MTKIKNTKKGMAKKTLSISLAVAMLATSNVPVWAAEFTDGTDAAFTSEAVVETPVEEVVTDAPVVEEEVAVDAQTTDNTQTNGRIKVEASQNGWASHVTVTGDVFKTDGKTTIKEFNYQWVVRSGSTERAIGDPAKTSNGIAGISKFAPGAENIGNDLLLHIWRMDTPDSRDAFDAWIPAGTVTKQDINNMNRLPESVSLNKINGTGAYDQKTHSYLYQYQKTEIKPGVASLVVKFDDGTTLDHSKNEFRISYRHPVGNFIDADSECEVVATPMNEDLYTGVVTIKYSIIERNYKAGDVTGKLADGVTFEYTGETIKPEKSDVVLTESVRGTIFDSSKVIDEIWSDGTFGVGEHTIGLSLIDVPNYKQSTLPKKGVQSGDDARITVPFTITKRDLSKCTVEIDPVALGGRNFETLVKDGKMGKYIHIFDAAGKELNLTLNTDYELDLYKVTPDTNGTYDVTIKAKNNTTGYKEAKLTIITHDFENGHFVSDLTNTNINADSTLEEAVPYTGETVTKDLSKLKFAVLVRDVSTSRLKWDALKEGEDYKVTFAGVDAGKNKGKVVVEGLPGSSYKGAKKTYYFDINPAIVEDTDVTVAGNVVFDRGNTSADDYAPTVSVKAHNLDNCKGKEFTLTEGKDYTVKYDYKRGYRNEIGGIIETTVTIINPNFKSALGKTVFVRETTISRKQLSNCTIEVVGDYTYTGAAIVPEVIVKDGNEVLVKDVDYVVKQDITRNNVNAGTAYVEVWGKTKNEEGDAIYDPTSHIETTFTINPADASNVEVVYAEGNTGVTYTGKPVKPTIVAVKLNGNDVTEQFDISYPGTYTNVGKGMVTLTPVKGNKNFVGTKDASFDIVARELTGTLTVYDNKGQQYYADVNDGRLYKKNGSKKEYVEFDYDGKERTFADAKFVPTGDYAKYVTENDYEIKYVDNLYGGKAYIYVEGKGNFAGKSTIVDAENETVKSVVEGTAYSFTINTYQFKDQHVEIKDAEYAAGQTAKPEVTVTVFGNKLVEGKDYILHYDNRVELTNGKTQHVWIEGIKAFDGSYVEGYYAVVKRDMKNTDVTVTGKNGYRHVVVKNTGVVVPESEYTVEFNGNNVTVTAKEGSKYYTGSQTKAIEDIVKPEKPFIKDVEVVGNSAKVILTDTDDNASGYDFVISTDPNCTVNKNYDNVIKNQLKNNATFQYAQTGVYYAYCHSWVRDENGQKLFSDWSEAYPFAISAITPDQPKITNVKVKGSTVTVTYTKTANASGYDVVLGSEIKKVGDAGEKRPVNYGKLVKKNIKGDVVTATFKNVPKGTYYAGLHAFNRTRTDNKKVFSPWSESKKVTVK